MKISVVIPAYNEEQLIGDCLRCLNKQTVAPDEIIVVDNNCTDKTAEIAKSMGATVIKEPKKGVIFARNTGFDAARGNIILRTDADTRPPNDWIEKIRDTFLSKEVDGVTGLVRVYDLPPGSTFFAQLLASTVKFFNHGKDLMIGPNMALTRDMWKQIREYVCMDQTQVHEDYDISLWIQVFDGDVFLDPTNIVEMSGRRIKGDPLSFFVEYPIRAVKTFRYPRFR
jgi:glycosyltransferase involved in cell wall biosynthesis